MGLTCFIKMSKINIDLYREREGERERERGFE